MPNPNYQQIFDRQGVPERFRGPDDYYFHTVTEVESSGHAGETYAIPTQVEVIPEEGPTELYDHYENGAIINVRTTVGEHVEFKGRAVVDARALEGETHVGWAATVGWDATLTDTYVGDLAVVGVRAIVENAHLSGGSKLGEDVDIRAGEDETLIGVNTTLENHVRLMGDNRVGADSTLHWAARVDQGADLGNQVELDERSVVGKHAKLADKVRVMEGVAVPAYKRVKQGTILVPKHHRRAKRGW